MDRRPAPVERIGNQAVLHQVVVNVIDVSGEIVVVADQVFPEAPLPEIIFAAPVAHERRAVANQPATERRLDRPPASRKVGVALRQGPERVQMVRQDDGGVDGEGSLPPASRITERSRSTCAVSMFLRRSRKVTVKK